MQDDEKESAERGADCSTNSCESFAWFDRASSCWRTSQRCLDGEWATYSESFPRAGTMRSGIAYRRPPSAPLTRGIGCSSSDMWPTMRSGDGAKSAITEAVSRQPYRSRIEQAVARQMWPTPCGIDATGGRTNRSASPNAAIRPTLGKAVRWPTPTKEDSRGGVSTTPGGARSTGLNATVRNWPTPKSRDWKDGASEGTKDRDSPDLGKVVGQSAATGSLNPTWVEWLMGFPPEWTALSASETPSSRKSRKSSGGG